MLLRERVWKRLFSQDVLSQSLPGLPLAELAGDRRVLIENHLGVTEYGPERIGIRVKYGVLYICGRGLYLLNMSKHQLVVCGMVDSLQLDRQGGGAVER